MKNNKSAVKIVLILLCVLLLGEIILFACRVNIAKGIYPILYNEIIEKVSDEYSVPKYLVCSIIWSESKFDPNAESSSGAMGLMQMTNSTFEEMQQRIGLKVDGQQIFEPEMNIRCGVYYISYLYRIYGDWNQTLAAYNAGLGNVKQWLDKYGEADFLENIPFKETREYISTVNKTYRAYINIYKKEK